MKDYYLHILHHLPSLAKGKEKETRKFFQKIRKKLPADFDCTIARLHHEAFAGFDCLYCANCCKTISPIIYISDIRKISNHLKISEKRFFSTYLCADEDNDIVFESLPCPFLLKDNRCKVYASRPHSCSTYPHTNHSKFYRLSAITIKNTYVCPVVFDILEKAKRHYGFGG
jgi:uncharacterized protein